MTMEVLMSIIGTLLLILLSALAWALRTLHADLQKLAESLAQVAKELREEIHEVVELANQHDLTLYGVNRSNGLVRDIREMKERRQSSR